MSVFNLLPKCPYPDDIFRWELEAMESVLVPLRKLPGEAVANTNRVVPVVSGSPSVSPPVKHLQNISNIYLSGEIIASNAVPGT